MEYEKHLRTANAGEGRSPAWVPTQGQERQLDEEMKNLKKPYLRKLSLAFVR